MIQCRHNKYKQAHQQTLKQFLTGQFPLIINIS